MPKGPCSSLSSPVLQKGNISPPQVRPHKTRPYLKRASSQYTISMQKHGNRSTMENIHTVQRSFVTPVPLQICFYCQSSLRQFCCLLRSRARKGMKSNRQEKRKKSVCVVSSQAVKKRRRVESLFSLQPCISPENLRKCAGKTEKATVRWKNRPFCILFNKIWWIYQVEKGHMGINNWG